MRTIVAAVLVSGLVSACAVAPEDDPVQIKLNDIDGRLQRIERANQSVVDMAQKLDATQAEIRTLRGRIDELQNNGEALKRQQRELYSDLDKRRLVLDRVELAPGQRPGDGATGGFVKLGEVGRDLAVVKVDRHRQHIGLDGRRLAAIGTSAHQCSSTSFRKGADRGQLSADRSRQWNFQHAANDSLS